MARSWLILLCITVCSTAYRQSSPYTYQSDPRAAVDLGPNPLPYFNRMVGEVFFKQESTKESNEEPIPYTVTQDFGRYEKRQYHELSMVCTHHEVDTAEDPFAGLRGVNPWALMQSRRFQKTPQSRMFRRLFRYISGVNQQGEEVEMTTPVSTLHKIVSEDQQGKVELQLMCFYLPGKYQPGGSQVEATARQAAISPPLPMEDSKVVLHTRPAMSVYVRRFGGFALTDDTWEEQRQHLLEDLIGKKHHDTQFFSASYNSPLQLEDRTNEIWVQDMEGSPEELASHLQELVDSDKN